MIYLITTFDARSIGLLPEFVYHYRYYGVENIIFTLHIDPNCTVSERHSIFQRAAELAAQSSVEIHSVYLSEYSSSSLRQFQEDIRLSIENKATWIVWADADEFHEFPFDLKRTIRNLHALAQEALGGRLVDRLPRSFPVQSKMSIWESFPVGTNLTEKVLSGWVRKIVLARSCLSTSPGHHFLACRDGNICDDLDVDYTVPIHHFKWDSSVVERLNDRLSEKWKSTMPWWTESEKAIRWIQENSSSISLSQLRITDFRDSAEEGIGPYSNNPRYTGGPYWAREISRIQYTDKLERNRVEYQPWAYQNEFPGEQRDIHIVLAAKVGSSIHHSCFIASGAVILADIIVMKHNSRIGASSMLRGKITIGSDCVIDPFVHLSGDISLGDRVVIQSGTKIFSHAYEFSTNRQGYGSTDNATQRITIGDNVVIGVNVVIVNGVSIGKNCVISPGSVVTQSFGENLIIEGNPAAVVDVIV